MIKQGGGIIKLFQNAVKLIHKLENANLQPESNQKIGLIGQKAG